MSCSCSSSAVAEQRARALVVGGTRFIGLPLVESLLAANYEVAVLNRGSHNDRLPSRAARIACDRKDHAALAAALADHQFEVVFDLVAYTPEDTEGLLSALGGSKAALEHFVHISTGSVYLPTERFPLKESFPRGLRGTGYEYGDRKYLIEELLFAAHQRDGLPVTVIRPGVVFGPWNYVYREAFYFDRLLTGRPLIVPGDGTVLTQFGYVDDLAAMMLAVPGNRRAIGEAYNFAGEYAVTTDYYMRTISDVVGERFGSELRSGARRWPEPEVIYYDPVAIGLEPAELRQVYPYRWREHVVRDMSKAQVELGYREGVDLAEGLRRALVWYLAGGRKECGFSPSFELEDRILNTVGR